VLTYLSDLLAQSTFTPLVVVIVVVVGSGALNQDMPLGLSDKHQISVSVPEELFGD